MKWIFAARLAGRSAAGIARELNERGVACPSEVDPSRNRHRAGRGWSLRTVVEILRNPRYTGRQVWNRVADRDLRYPGTPREWVISARSSHPALVSERDFVAAQTVRVSRTAADGAIRVYRLSGLVRCGLCARRMDSHWVNHRAGYRCRHGHTSAQQMGRGVDIRLSGRFRGHRRLGHLGPRVCRRGGSRVQHGHHGDRDTRDR